MHNITFIQITILSSPSSTALPHITLEVVHSSGNAKLCMPLDIILTNKQLKPTFLYLQTKIPCQRGPGTH